MRGMRTLFLRFERQSENALRFARHFESHPLVERVLYPGLESHPGHELASRQMRGGFGGMLSILVKGNAQQAQDVCLALALVLIGASLGGIVRVVEHRAVVEGLDSVGAKNIVPFSICITT